MKRNLLLILALTIFQSVFAQEPTKVVSPISEPLSPATSAKISAMTPIFDGKTLDGWIQSPINYNLNGGDISNFTAFAERLMESPDGVSVFLKAQLDDDLKKSLAQDIASGTKTKATVSAFTKALNKIISGPSIYDQTRFAEVHLHAKTQELLKNQPQGQPATHLNRALLEDVYPTDLTRSLETSWVMKDGAMASTGAGRGVIYTKGDYTNYRIIFDLRQVSGNHQPCVLLFCSRPADGEKGLDALGGIQFQVPNGGHWDYRPGFNNGGNGFKNPVKTKYNNHEWSQVEILVNAKNGTARMAVAEPIGTKATENLDYNNPDAGKSGPFALQMHNAGLFDEYKDLRIEIDPKEDKLITTEQD